MKQYIFAALLVVCGGGGGESLTNEETKIREDSR